MKGTILTHLYESQALLSEFLDSNQVDQIEKAAKSIIDSVQRGGKVIACGNGGSMSDAMHFVAELMGKYRDKRSPIPAIAINDPAYLSCTANDMGYEYVFSRTIIALGKPEDVVLLITTSGNSENITLAAEAANYKCQGNIILLTSEKCPESLSRICQTVIKVPSSKYADRIQEIHIKVLHILAYLIEEELTSPSATASGHSFC